MYGAEYDLSFYQICIYLSKISYLSIFLILNSDTAYIVYLLIALNLLVTYPGGSMYVYMTRCALNMRFLLAVDCLGERLAEVLQLLNKVSFLVLNVINALLL